MRLDAELFGTIVAHTPLVSIDLVIESGDGQVLLGQRLNRPAQGFWFVPGGRIYKDERIASALRRIVHTELGPDFPPLPFEFSGVYEHLYTDSFVADEAVSTHYVVLAHRVVLTVPTGSIPLQHDPQHEGFQWWDVATLLASEAVHENTKAYFRP